MKLVASCLCRTWCNSYFMVLGVVKHSAELNSVFYHTNDVIFQISAVFLFFFVVFMQI